MVDDYIDDEAGRFCASLFRDPSPKETLSANVRTQTQKGSYNRVFSAVASLAEGLYTL